MKKAMIFILFCAAALPAALVAQTAEAPAAETPATPLIKTKWTLTQPKQAKPKMPGPRVPPPARLRVPQSHAAQRAKRPPPKQRPNNAPIVSAISQAKRKSN